MTKSPVWGARGSGRREGIAFFADMPMSRWKGGNRWGGGKKRVFCKKVTLTPGLEKETYTERSSQTTTETDRFQKKKSRQGHPEHACASEGKVNVRAFLDDLLAPLTGD